MKKGILCALVCLLLALAAPAFAKTIYVNGSYTGGSSTGEKTAPYTTIRYALGNAVAGDVIELLGDTPLLHSVDQASYANINCALTIRSEQGKNYSILANAAATAARRSLTVKADLVLENVSFTPSPNPIYLTSTGANLTIKGGTSRFFSMTMFNTITFDGAKASCTSSSMSIRPQSELKLMNGSEVEASIMVERLTATGASSTLKPIGVSNIVSAISVENPILLSFKDAEGEAAEETLAAAPVHVGNMPSGNEAFKNCFQVAHTSPRGQYVLTMSGNSLYVGFEFTPADYSQVDAAIAQAAQLNPDHYEDFSAVEATLAAVVPGKRLTQQAEVDAMAQAILDAIAALTLKAADYSAVNAAIAAANALEPANYVDFSGVQQAIAAVVWNLDITQQTAVNAMAQAILDAIAALVPIPVQLPQTGDNSQMMLWLAGMALGCAALMGLGRRKRA